MATTEAMKVVRLYDVERGITNRVAREMFEGNESAAIRYMIREHGRRLVDPPASYVTEDEAADAVAAIR